MRNDQTKKFINDNRWPLAKQFLDRADHAGTIIRGLLFSVASAAIGLIVHERQGADLRPHLWPLLLLGLSVIVVFISWNMQKGKMIKRFEALRDGEPHYDPNNLPWYRQNYILDYVAAFLFAAGIILEIVIRLSLP